MADELKFNIGADVSDFQKGVTQVNTGLTSLQKASVNTGTTLTNLSRVASDAPFGFIAIQNNLEPLIQGFGSLSKQSGGTGAALKALAGSLAGPAGLAVGFSVVSALVTTAIQKYGSLGNAISELAASSDIASVNQRKLASVISESAASSQGEINTLNNYIGILRDVTIPQQERINAYNILKKEFPAVIQNLSVENALTAQGGQIIAQRSQQLIKYIKLKGQEKALIALIEKEYETQYKTLQGLTNTLKDGDSFLNQFINSALGGGIAVVGLSRRVSSYTNDINNAAKSSEFFETTLKGIQQEIASTDPNIIDPQAAIKAQQNAVKAAEETAKKIAAANLKAAKDAAKEQKKLDDEEDKRRLQRLKNFQAQQAQIGKALPKAGATQIEQKPLGDVSIGQQDRINRLIAQGAEIQKKNLDELILKGQTAATVFGQVFNPIVDQFFTNIEEGQNVFKGFGDVIKQFVKNAIIQLVKLAAFAAITSIFSGGATSFGKAFTSGLGGAFGLPKLGGVSAGGVNVNVAGQFALRGTDLVASVGASQQRIKRVG